MSHNNPKVSVCLVTYNGAATVGRSLATLLAQTYRDYELIISDDHSTDDTLALCQHLAGGHDQVRFIGPERNVGAQANLLFALSHARGKYFVWACQDDYWEPEFLERLVEALEQSSKALFAQGRTRRVYEDGSDAQEFRLHGRDLPEWQSRLELAASILVRRSHNWGVVIHGMFDRDAYIAALNAHGKIFTDSKQILCHLALAGGFRYVDQLLFHKVISNRPLHDRRLATDDVIVARAGRSHERELRKTLAGVVRSPIVAPGMKLIAPPTLYARFWWRHGAGRVGGILERALTASQFRMLRRLYRTIRRARHSDVARSPIES